MTRWIGITITTGAAIAAILAGAWIAAALATTGAAVCALAAYLDQRHD